MCEKSAVIYHAQVPEWFARFWAAPPMQRIRRVGMNCGCEYTSFPRFRRLPPYSRYRHSVGAGLITWHFTGSMEQALAALFHDIATPVFAHTVDFMHGDYLRQEYTEGRTESIIADSPELSALLGEYGIPLSAVSDYHIYPIADNDSPRLSADRLEYTLGNLSGFARREAACLQAYYDDICVASAEDGAPELAFKTADTALAFGRDALEMSRIYVAPEDRYAMQRLSELLKKAVGRGAVSMEELYGTEDAVIARLRSDAELCAEWERYCALHRMLSRDEILAGNADSRVIPAKKRGIDPFVLDKGRLSAINAEFAEELQSFMEQPLDAPICGV